LESSKSLFLQTIETTPNIRLTTTNTTIPAQSEYAQNMHTNCWQSENGLYSKQISSNTNINANRLMSYESSNHDTFCFYDGASFRYNN
jgi:hypothetical protein